MSHIAAKFAAVAVAAIMMAGCNNAAPTAGLTAESLKAAAKAAPTEVAVSATLNVTGPTGYRVLTLTAWNKADIDHVTLTLYKDAGAGYVATGATKTVANAALASAISLGNLRLATNYKVVARAYADAAETNEIDNIAATGSDANCSTAFTTPSLVTNAAGDNVNDASISLAIPVRLKDKTFAGAAGGTGVAVTNGTIVDTTASETF